MTDKPVRPSIPEQVFLQPSCGSPSDEELEAQAATLDADAKAVATAAAGPAQAKARGVSKQGVRTVPGGAPSLGKRRR
ncbi:hypothetical protein AQJ84_11005 [Streptomyces resistomycificus]|uniref:Uncharacterized protein n=1 Tax=Streptomyces resistomycificus TaxID=67356 RepID=A0A0L8L599_9ACTN|nr:hypothetical protein ADK37_23055 [Streptomyces resistomycificus]KUN99469.1 hypothetical protein AQJ84_11005 [Streptomyces resistomycificus]